MSDGKWQCVARAVEAVSAAAQNAETAEAKNDQPESISNEWVPLLGAPAGSQAPSC
jgi:hypothetical protein